jgi:hypothetical protein
MAQVSHNVSGLTFCAPTSKSHMQGGLDRFIQGAGVIGGTVGLFAIVGVLAYAISFIGHM